MPVKTHARSERVSRNAVAVFAAALLLGTAGCADDSSSGEDSNAPEPAELTVYSGRSDTLVQPLFDKFTEQTGIEVEFRGGDSGELASQIITEGDNTPADVFFSQDAGALGAVEKADLFAEIDDTSLERVDTKFRSAAGKWVGTSGRVRVIVYNPGKVAEPPSAIDELLDPKWKGKIGFAPTNASFQSFVTGLRVLRGDDGALEWLNGFAANEPVAFEKNGAVRDAVDQGEVELGLVNHYYLYEAIKERGADKVTARNQYLTGGDPGGLVNVAGVGVLSNSDSPKAAQQLVEFLLSDDAQTYFAEDTFEYPLVEGVPLGDPELPTLEELDPPDIDLSDLDTIAETQELLAEAGLLTR